MHDFKLKNGELTCESVKVSSVAKKVGTPFYLYSHKTIVDHFIKIKKAFKSIDPLVCFAMKANDNMAILKILVDQGAGFDIVSLGELKKAVKVKADCQKIVFASVGKTDEEIVSAIKANILYFNAESLPEIERIDKIAGRLKKKVRVALRINPDVDAATHQKITTGTLKNKFGIDLKTAGNILINRGKFKNLNITGLHTHIGSQITQVKPFIASIKKVAGFLDELRKKGVELETFNIGGGLGIIYKDETPQTADQFAKTVIPHLKRTGLKIILEPGRFIVGNAGIFVSKVVYLKDNGAKKFLIVDGGMNDMMRPTLYNAYHEIVPVKKSGAKKIKVDVVGPICESGDFFAKDRLLQTMKKGDLLAVMSAGAYGHVMSSNYNVRPRTPEVLVKGSKYYIIRERETFNDLIKHERIPAFLK